MHKHFTFKLSSVFTRALIVRVHMGSGGVINRLSQEFINKKGLEAFKALLEREAKKGSEELKEGAATTEGKNFHASWYWRRKKKRQQSERG